MQVFQTKKQIAHYISSKEKKMRDLGFYARRKDYDYYGCTVTWEPTWDKRWLFREEHISILLYSEHVGKGLVKTIQEYRNKPIATLKDCGISDYLKDKKIPHTVVDKC